MWFIVAIIIMLIIDVYTLHLLRQRRFKEEARIEDDEWSDWYEFPSENQAATEVLEDLFENRYIVPTVVKPDEDTSPRYYRDWAGL